MIIREFITRLGFDADDSKVRGFDASVAGLVRSLTLAVGAMQAVAAAAFGLANATANYGDEVAKSAATVGLSAESLQALRFAYERAGIGQQELTAGLERLNRNLGSVAQGEEAARAGFDALGISATNADGSIRTVSELMPEIVEALKGVSSEAERAAIAQELFGRSGVRMGSAIAGGADELTALIAEFERLGGGLTNEQAKAAEVFNDQLTDMNTAINSIRLQIGAELMPVFLPMVKAFTEFVATNRDGLIEGIAKAFTVVSEVAQRMTATVLDVVSGLSNLFGMLAGGADGFDRLGMVVAALAAMFLPKRWLFIGTLIALLDDIAAWAQGHDSVIGRLIGPYEDWAESINAVVDAFGGWERVGDALYVILLGITGLRLARWAWAAATAVWGLAAAFGAAATAGAATSGALAAAGVGAGAAAGGTGVAMARLRAVAGMLGKLALPVAAIGMVSGAGMGDADFQAEISRRIDQSIGAPSVATAPGVDPSLFMGPQVVPQASPQVAAGASPVTSADFDELRAYLDNLSVIQPTAESIAGGDVDNSVTNNVSVDLNQSITVPPGTTSEQLAIIRREAEGAIERAVDRAAAALEN